MFTIQIDSRRRKIDVTRLDLSTMFILEFEYRVKRFAHPCNSGKLSITQLKEAFKDTDIFNALGNPRSVVHRLLVSPFFTDFQLSHTWDNRDFFSGARNTV